MWIIQKLNIYTNTYIEIALASKGPILSVTGIADARSRSDQFDAVPRVFGMAAELRLAADQNSAHCHRCQRASSMEVITAFENGQESVIDFGRRLTCQFASAQSSALPIDVGSLRHDAHRPAPHLEVVAIPLLRQAAMVDTYLDIGIGRRQFEELSCAFRACIDAGDQVEFAQQFEARVPLRVDQVLSRTKIANAAHVVILQMAFENGSGIRLIQVTFRDNGVGASESPRAGLQPFGLPDGVYRTQCRLDMNCLGYV